MSIGCGSAGATWESVFDTTVEPPVEVGESFFDSAAGFSLFKAPERVDPTLSTALPTLPRALLRPPARPPKSPSRIGPAQIACNALA